MSYGEIPQGWYTEGNYYGYVGRDPYGYIASHNPGTYLTKGNRLYMRFETESAYIEWWQDRFNEKEVADAPFEN